MSAGVWKTSIVDFRMGIALQLISWALSIMPVCDPQAQRIAAGIEIAIAGRLS